MEEKARQFPYRLKSVRVSLPCRMKYTKCKFCGGSSFFELTDFVGTTSQYKNRSFTYARCKTCHSIFLLTKLSVDYTNYVTTKYVPKLLVNRFVKFLPYCKIKKNSNILDYGCGEGTFISELRKKGFVNLKGYEPYNTKYNKTLETGEKFSLVYLNYVFEHLTNFKLLFTNLKKVTDVGSKIMLLCPSSTRIPKMNSKCPFQHFLIHAPYHNVIPSDKAIIDLFNKNKYSLKFLLPYDIQRSGFIINNRVFSLFFKYMGGTKERFLNPTSVDKIIAVFNSPLAFFSSMFLHVNDPFISTFVFERVKSFRSKNR